ncbi:type II secretion system F family protein [Candidatus Poseidonia alphae]|uniref:type II secretion system F family protein n=1 Tax=Candidatus Poseidonia alphae TaxID=1915863 RepID=UPI002317F644|nr:type II secretion system F family protein [Candidatus Poseidonia alphae]MDA8530517.1 type II secretion system F family protein [Candidatus Poseidonia alphae]MDA8638159.1 type II secretion system F family protein [Candidatus Poseidonia alphae]MDA8749704.1 type II secretion system F family protein [Candidatus Poseidonia alphae]MDA8759701.1 type II secretion system F family protein [Candidatus Poseidonia alphae]
MRKLEEKRELLYVIRTLDVLMSSGVGLEAALHTIGKGGYGIISEDFSAMMKRLQKGTGGGIDKELKSLMKKAESKGYKRLLNTLYTNVTQNTDLVETLKKQGARMEEERTEEVEKYIEELGGVPETLLSIGMIGPIILAIVGLVPQLMSGDLGAFMSLPPASTINVVVNIGLIMTLVGMSLIGLKAHTKDPGL